MELELNSKPRSLIRCRLEKIWVWDEMEVDVRSGEGGGELQQRGVYKETVDMDEQMWGNLPGHLLESHILVRLPLESLFRFRSVYSIYWRRIRFIRCVSRRHCVSKFLLERIFDGHYVFCQQSYVQIVTVYWIMVRGHLDQA
ncbi:unnamed protein product [Calypogeia fissa]